MNKLELSNEDYRKLDALAQSDLAWMRYSPRHFINRAKMQKETEAMKFGTIFHAALLEPMKFKELYIVEPDKITIEGKLVEVNKRVAKHREYLNAWRVDNAHRMIVTDAQLDSLITMINSVKDDPELAQMIRGGVPECISLWDYRGRKCKGKADLFNDQTPHGRVVVDFKKTQDASEAGFSRSIFNYAYDLQSAWYVEGFKADKFFFVAVEEKTGAIGKWDAEYFIERGKKLMDRLLDRLDECERTGEWPWYTRKGFELIRPPVWLPALEEEGK